MSDLAGRYCIPMDSPRPILPAELAFFAKGTGKGKYLLPGIWIGFYYMPQNL